MPELIDREETLQLIDQSIEWVDGSSLLVDGNCIQDRMTKNGLLVARRIVSKQPTIEAEPVRHGRWIQTTLKGYYECSDCRYEHTSNPDQRFCSYCGARMDGGADNENL